MSLDYTVPPELIDIFRQQATQKIEAEGWGKQGRNVAVKIDNFVHCWTTEEAFKQILMKHKVWFRHRGLYFGDASGAGADFTVRMEGKEVSVGLRSVAPESLNKWKTVAYPDDRFRLEKEKIADYHLVCNHAEGLARFFGIISKAELLKELEVSRRLYSPRNQEHFRVIPLEKFSFEEMMWLLETMEKV
ncbi:hypothetical protein HYX14_06650 [Candidatus Woesearchaeota archaeon]|nr:hypothetical protein [Candidatus Woesearchaeota archaeon]